MTEAWNWKDGTC